MADVLRDLVIAVDFKGINLSALTKLDNQLNSIEKDFIKMDTDINRFSSDTDKSTSKVDRLGEELRKTTESGNDLGNGFRNAGDQMEEMGRRGDGVFSSMTSSAKGFLLAIGAIKAFDFAKDKTIDFVKTGIDYNATMETSQMAWSSILHSQTQAVKTMKDLQQFAIVTPYEYKDVDKAGKLLNLAGWTNENNMMAVLKGVGDAVAKVGGNGGDIVEISRQMMQIGARGKSEWSDLAVMAERGIPVIDMLAKKFGTTSQGIMDMSQKGQLLAKDVLPALAQSMEEWGKGSMDQLSKTFSGQLSNTKDFLDQFAGDVTKGLFDNLRTNVLPKVNDFIQGVKDAFDKTDKNGKKAGWSGVIGYFFPNGKDEILQAFKDVEIGYENMKSAVEKTNVKDPSNKNDRGFWGNMWEGFKGSVGNIASTSAEGFKAAGELMNGNWLAAIADFKDSNDRFTDYYKQSLMNIGIDNITKRWNVDLNNGLDDMIGNARQKVNILKQTLTFDVPLPSVPSGGGGGYSSYQSSDQNNTNYHFSPTIHVNSGRDSGSAHSTGSVIVNSLDNFWKDMQSKFRRW